MNINFKRLNDFNDPKTINELTKLWGVNYTTANRQTKYFFELGLVDVNSCQRLNKLGFNYEIKHGLTNKGMALLTFFNDNLRTKMFPHKSLRDQIKQNLKENREIIVNWKPSTNHNEEIKGVKE